MTASSLLVALAAHPSPARRLRAATARSVPAPAGAAVVARTFAAAEGRTTLRLSAILGGARPAPGAYRVLLRAEAGRHALAPHRREVRGPDALSRIVWRQRPAGAVIADARWADASVRNRRA